jgi:hypothetical protein
VKNIIHYSQFLNESQLSPNAIKAINQAIEQQKQGLKSIYDSIKRKPEYAGQHLQLSEPIIQGAKSLYMTLSKAPGVVTKATLDQLVKIAKLDWKQARLILIADSYKKLIDQIEEEYKGFAATTAALPDDLPQTPGMDLPQM